MSFNIKILPLILCLFPSTFAFVSCVVEPSNPTDIQNSTEASHIPPQGNHKEISYGTKLNFSFAVGSPIEPITPQISNQVSYTFTEDTNSEIQTLKQLGLSLDSNTGVISGIPVEKAAGTTQINILAKNIEITTKSYLFFKLNIKIDMEKCPENLTNFDENKWLFIHGINSKNSDYFFRYSNLNSNHKMECFYEKKILKKDEFLNSGVFLVLERKNKLFNSSNYVKKHPEKWISNSPNSFICQPNSGDVGNCPIY